MMIDAVIRAASILQSQPGYSMPLVRLHAQLVREFGPAAGTYAEIYQQLRKRSDSFAILNTPRILGATDAWPGLVREAYDDALESAGFGSCVRVALTETQSETENADLLKALNVTLGELITRAADDENLAGYIESATHALAELNQVFTAAETSRPTTPPPDPRPAT